MNGDRNFHEAHEASTASLAAVVGILIGAALAFTAATAPISKLLGPGAGALPAAMHGLRAFLYLFVGMIGLYLGWRLMAPKAVTTSATSIPTGMAMLGRIQASS